MKILLSAAVLMLVTMASCGDSHNEVTSSLSSVSLQGEEREKNTEDLSSVSFTLSGTPTITPSKPPASTETITSLSVSFDVVVDRTSDTSFIYNKSYWRIGFLPYTDTGTMVEISATPTATGTETMSGNTSTMSVTLSVDLPTGLPTDVKTMLSSAETSTGRRKVQLVAVYRNGTTASASDRLVKMLWAGDIGAIVSGPTAFSPTVSDQTLVARWIPPSDTSAVVRSSGSLEDAGDSSISAYLLAYWDIENCSATGAQWNWQSNSELDASGASTSLTGCSFSASSAAQYTTTVSASACTLGCDTTASTTYTGKSPEDVAVPSIVPDSSQVGVVVAAGCYRVVRVAKKSSASESSFSIPDLVNGRRYGMMIYNIDSSGHVSLGRSACAFGTPIPVPLPGDEKTGGAQKKRMDCFVATAASGSSNSMSVHYWRVIRDTWLANTAFVDWYYKNGPALAAWLNENPSLKPAVNFVLEKTGKLMVDARYFVRDVVSYSQNFTRAALEVFEKLFVSSANASDEISLERDLFLQPASGHVDFHYLKMGMSTDKKLWDAYFRENNKAKSLYAYSGTLGYSLLSGRWGEFGVAGLGTYFGSTGKVPATLPSGAIPDSQVVGTDHVSTTLMLGAGLDARFRIPHASVSWLAPRAAVFGAIARTRMEARMPSDASRENGDEWPVGYTFLKRIVVARCGVDVMLGRLFEQEVSEARNVDLFQDFGFQFFGEMWNDTSSSISLSSQQWGLGLTILFE